MIQKILLNIIKGNPPLDSMLDEKRQVANVQGRASESHLSLFKGIVWISDFFPLDTDNFAARDPWTWRWREETRLIPHPSELDTATESKDGRHVGPAQRSLQSSDGYGITLVSSFQRQVHGSLAVKLSVSMMEKSEILKNSCT